MPNKVPNGHICSSLDIYYALKDTKIISFENMDDRLIIKLL
jgi:hypothetical protein